MKLFLASEAKHPDSLEKLETFVDGFKGKSIAYIPSAANGEGSFGEWKETSGSWQVVNSLGAEVTPVQLEDFRNRSVIDQIKWKDIVWFAGGMCGYLMYWIRRCEIDKHIREILEEGTIFVGSSAGSMVTNPDLRVIDLIEYESEHGASIIPTMKLVDFWIYPHFQEEYRSEIESKWTEGKLYLLKDGEAITVVNDKVTTFGEERVIKNLL